MLRINNTLNTAPDYKNSNNRGQIAAARPLLNAEMFGDMTTSSGREFHKLITRTAKNLLLASV